MKNILLLLLLIFIQNTMAGGLLPKGNIGETLPAIERIVFGPSQLGGMYTGTADPTSVAVFGNAGAMYQNTTTGKHYIKTDDGLSTNWYDVQTKIGDLETLNDGLIYVGNASNQATGVAVSGEATIVNTGAITLDNDSVIGKTLTGYSAGTGVVDSSDSIISGIQKLDGNIAGLGSTYFTLDQTTPQSVINGIPTFLGLGFDTAAADPTHAEGLLFYDQTHKGLSYYNEEADVKLNLGQERFVRVYNDTGATITNGMVVYITGENSNFPTIGLASNINSSALSVMGIATHDIEDATYGYVAADGIIHDYNTAAWASGTKLYLSTAGALTSTRPDLPAIVVEVGDVIVQDAAVGSILLNVKESQELARSTSKGMSFSKHDTSVVEDGGVLYFEVEQDGGGNMVYSLDNGPVILDCLTGAGTGGKARVALTAGTATVPQQNFLYVTGLAGVGTLTSSTTRPTGDFAWVGTATVPDATTFGTTGAYMHQRYNDAVDHDGRGALSYERERIRKIGARYLSGVDQTLTVTTNVGTPDNVVFTSTAGEVYQLHRQTFPAFSGTPTYYVVNDSVTPYKAVTDLNELLTDANGDSLSGTRFNLVIWGAVNKTTGESKLYVNLPTGSYNNNEQAVNDVNNTAVTSIPAEINGVGFLIGRLALRHTVNSGGTWVNLSGGTSVVDLRGLAAGFNTGGSVGGSTNEFSDALFTVFDDGDSSKTLQFQNSGITTATNRVLTIPDADGTIALTDELDLNYVVNGAITNSINNFTSSDPTDIIISLDTSSKVRGANSMEVAKLAGPATDDYVYSDTFTIDAVDKASMMTLSFEGDFTDNSYDDDDMSFRVYDITNSAYLTGKLYIKSMFGKQSFDYQTTATGTQYQVRLYQETGNTSAYDVYVKNIKFGPQKSKVYGTPSTAPENYSPTLTNFGNGTASLSQSRVGNKIHIQGTLVVGSTVPTGIITFSLPSGLNADYSSFPVGLTGTDAFQSVGTAHAYNPYYSGNVIRNASSTTEFYVYGDGAAFGTGPNNWNATVPMTWVAGDTIEINISVPIQGWSNNVVMSETTQNREIWTETYKTGTAQAITASTETKITFDSIYVDKTNIWDAANNRVTVTEGGSYNVCPSIAASNTSGTDSSVTVGVKINGAAGFNTSAIVTLPTGKTTSKEACFKFDLSKGDYVEIWISADQAVSVLTTSGVYGGSRFSLSKTNTGSQTIAQSERETVRYTTAAAQSIGNGTTDIVDFGTLAFSDHGFVTTGSSWKYQPSMPGRYRVTAHIRYANSLSWTLGSYAAIFVYKNGVGYATEDVGIQYTGTHATGPSVDVSAIVDLNGAGDYIDIRSAHGESAGRALLASGTHNYIDIERIK